MVIDGAIDHSDGVDFRSASDEGLYAEVKTTAVTGAVSHFNKALKNSALAVSESGGHTLLFYVFYLERNNMKDGSGGEPDLTSLETERLKQVRKHGITIEIFTEPIPFTPYQ